MQLTQLLLQDAKFQLAQLCSPNSIFPPSFFSLLRVFSPVPSPPAVSDVCTNPATFPTLPLTSRPIHNMALADETTRVVSQFDFSDTEVNCHVNEFLKQMRTSCAAFQMHTKAFRYETIGEMNAHTSLSQARGWRRMARA